MNSQSLLCLLIALFLFSHPSAEAQVRPIRFSDRAPKLDDPYPFKKRPAPNRSGKSRVKATKTNFVKMLSLQSPVKSQGSRGTCSIFSATALVESMIMKWSENHRTFDLSEEWLQYLNMSAQGTSRKSEGGHSYANFKMIETYGIPRESTLPYISVSWKSGVDSHPLAKERCSNLSSALSNPNQLIQCLHGHFPSHWLGEKDANISDKNFVEARREAKNFKDEYLKYFQSVRYSASIDEIRALLLQEIPVTIDVDFYYGAWNHGKASSLGIDTNQEHWDEGIIFTPVSGSIDEKVSEENSAGHSVLIIGYDDEKIVQRKVKMVDGSWKEVQTKGGYYFKNSWGTSSFGRKMKIQGVSAPGYGFIPYEYAHEYGTFYRFMIPKN